MNNTSVGQRFWFAQPVRCVLLSRGIPAFIPKGDAVTVKSYGKGRFVMLAEWNSAEVLLFKNDIDQSGGSQIARLN
jgi:hypothetical protein